MTDTYNDALAEQAKKNVWDNLASEAANMTPLERASVTADIVGIFDPTPISDGAGFVLSAAQGDALGALLSLGSMVPYAGDALAKPFKIASKAPKTAKALEAMFHASDNLAKAGKDVLQKAGLSLEQVAAARKKALGKVQQAMMDARKKTPGCEECKKLVDEKTGETRQLIMPSGDVNGKWKQGKQPVEGNDSFVFDEPKILPNGKKVTEIEFRNGSPIYDDYVVGEKYKLWEVSGKVSTDTRRLKEMMPSDWIPPDNKKFVLHHFDDGMIGYIPRSIHDTLEGGTSHTGGNSMINNKLF